MKRLKTALKDNPVIYITRDIDRALGLPLDTPGYHSISNYVDTAKLLKERANILLIEEDHVLNTRELLKHPKSAEYIDALKKKYGDIQLVVFKPTMEIERICDEHEWTLLNPAALHANAVEEKTSQVEWLGELNNLLPKHRVTTCTELTLDEAPYIVQFNRAHTGEGTLLIESQKQIDALKKKHPKRDVRVSEYIQGPIFTSNNVVTEKDVLVGNISYQITGVAPYTENRFATIGNDWGIPHSLLNDGQQKAFQNIATVVGEKLRDEGWRGLFGVDIVTDEKTGKLYLIEINARQPQSTTYASKLQRDADPKGLTTFEAHLCALLGLKIDGPLTTIKDGAHIIDRRSNRWIRSATSIMKDHNKLKEQPKQENEDWQTLSPEATKVVDDYLNLPIAGKSVQCPYMNNKRQKLRGALRVVIGKGTPEEIIEEASLIALKKKIDLETLDEEAIKRFLIDHNLGIECSGFVYHALDAELQAHGKGSLKQHLKFPHIKNPLRKFLAKIRIVENTNVKVLNNIANSTEVSLKNVTPGDIITQMDIDGRMDHVFLVQGIEFENKKPTVIFYTHSNQMPADGKYDHGVRQGSITITDLSKPIEKQQWPNEDNTMAKYGENVSLRRLNALM